MLMLPTRRGEIQLIRPLCVDKGSTYMILFSWGSGTKEYVAYPSLLSITFATSTIYDSQCLVLAMVHPARMFTYNGDRDLQRLTPYQRV